MATTSTIRWLALGVALALGAPAAQAQPAPIKIGELNSYARQAAFTVPYRDGWQLALDEINAKGGVLGRKIEIVSREDGATTGDATRVADELVSREGVSLLFGSFLSNVGVAMADFANQKKIVYIAAEPLTDAITMAQGNRYTFRIRPNNFMQVGMLVEQAKASGAKRWAIVAPNYEYGQSAAEAFKRLIQERVPGAQIVAEQYPALGKIEAGATVSALEQAKPDGIFNVLFGPDLTQFVREGNTRGLFEGKTVLSLLTGEPEWLLPLKDEVPGGLDRDGLSLGRDHRAEAQGLRRRLPRQVQRHAASRLAPRLHGRLHDPRHHRARRLHRDRGHHQGARGCEVRHRRRPRHHARHRQPVHHGRLGRQARAQRRRRRHDRLDIQGRHLVHADRGRGEGGPEGLTD